jgi:hypothetical protein
VADLSAVSFVSGVLQGISQTVPDNILAGGLKRASGDVTIDAGGANSIVLRTNGVSSVTINSGGKLTTSSTTTTPAILIGSFAGDPSGLANGDVWYNSTTGKFRARENGSSVDMISAGGGGGWTDDGTVVRLTTSTDDVSIGSATSIGKLGVFGDTVGEKTLAIRQVASQTAAALTVQNSAGTDLMTLTGLTTLTYQHGTAISAVTFRTADESSGGGTAGSASFVTGSGGDASGATAGGAGGAVAITTGYGGNASSTSGGTAAAGGLLNLSCGWGGGGDSTGIGELNGADGGTILLTSGQGGAAGSGGTAGYGGNITITSGGGGNLGGTSGTTPAASGNISLSCGYGGTGDPTGYGGTGGSITLTAGEGGYVNGGSSPGTAGTITLTGGKGGQGDGSVAAQSGGNVLLVGGEGGVDGGAGGGPGGNIYIRGGNASGSQTDGGVYIGDTNTNAIQLAASNILVTCPGYISTTTSSTRPAITIGNFAGDPSTLSNGAIWYNSTTGKFRARENGSSVDMIGGGASGWTDDGGTVRLTTASDEVAIGTATAFGKLGVLNDATGQVVIAARCASGQSSNPFEIQSNGGSAYFTVDITGRVKCAPGPSGSGGAVLIDAGATNPSVIWDKNNTLSNTISFTQTVASSNSELTVTAGTYIIPATNNTGQIGKSGQKWATGYFGVMVTGDLVMEDESRDASWRFVEHHEHIEVVNQKTGKKYKLALQELPE